MSSLRGILQVIVLLQAGLAAPCVPDLLNNYCEPFCLYATYDSKSECATKCALTCDRNKLGDGTCDYDCAATVCGLDQGDCTQCSPGCSVALLQNSNCDLPCWNAACGYDLGNCARGETARYYVTKEANYTLPAGTFNGTFSDLTTALSTPSLAKIALFCLNTEEYSLSTGLNLPFSMLTIATCSCLSISCARATIRITKLGISFTVSQYVLLENVNLNAKTPLKDCTNSPFCYYYCPKVYLNASGTCTSDQGKPLSLDFCRNIPNSCTNPAFSALFQVNSAAIMELRNVKVTEIRYQPEAVFLLKQGASLLLTNVFFSNIIPKYPQGAVILQKEAEKNYPEVGGNVLFTGGGVELLYNGLGLDQGKFEAGSVLSGDGLRDIVVQNVVFQRNLVWNIDEEANGLLYFRRFRTLWVDKCDFTLNIASYLLSIISKFLALSSTLDSNDRPADFHLTHILISSSVFSSNIALFNLISVVSSGDAQSFQLAKASFRDNIVLEAEMVGLWYDGMMQDEAAYGGQRLVKRNDNSDFYASFPARFVSLQNTTFLRNSAKKIFKIDKFTNIDMQFCSFLHNGNVTAYFLTLAETLAQFVSDSQVYLDENQANLMYRYECEGLISCTDVKSEVKLSRLLFEQNNCKEGPTGLMLSGGKGVFTLENSNFLENASEFDKGAVLHLNAVNFTISLFHLSFVGNIDEKSTGQGVVYLGPQANIHINYVDFLRNRIAAAAGILSEDPLLFILQNALFESNEAREGSGGAVSFTLQLGPFPHSIAITNTAFRHNSSPKGVGGALYMTCKTSTRPYNFSMTSSEFLNNSAVSGSALTTDSQVVLDPTSLIRNCTFLRNKSTARGTVYLQLEAGRLTLENCSFTENDGVTGTAVTLDTTVTVYITNCVFMRNSGEQGIVALIHTDWKKSLVTANCYFIGNKGTGVVATLGTWQDRGSTFEGNSNGAVWLTSGSYAVVNQTKFTGNIALEDGGAVYITSRSTFNCSNCNFTGNSAVNNGGAVYADGHSTLHIDHSLFLMNSAKTIGSALTIMLAISEVSTLSFSALTSNHVDELASIGLLYAILVMSDCQLSSNTAGDTSPGVVLNMAHLYASFCLFHNHTGVDSGFIYAATDSKVVIENSRFNLGVAVTGGGFTLLESNLTLRNCTLEDLMAVTGAAFVALGSCALQFFSVRMTGLRANESAIGYMRDGQLTLEDVEISSFEKDGIVVEKASKVTITRSSFSGGKGALGCAFFCSRCQAVLISNSNFSSNYAEYNGIIFLETVVVDPISAVYLIKETVFHNNTASEGGAVVIESVNVHFQDCVFSNNTALVEAGGVSADCLVDNCRLSFSNCRFENNTAKVQGGGISWKSVKPNVTNCWFSGNQAEYGANISSFPVALQRYGSGRGLSEGLEAVASGQAAHIMQFALVDHYGEILTINNESTAELLAENPLSTSLSGVTSVTASRGIFTFDQYVITAVPGSTTSIRLQTSAIEPKAQDSTTYNSSLQLTCSMRECVLGEVLVGNKTCYVCESGKYSLDPRQTACLPCPQEAVCLGNFTMGPKAGYWRARNDSDFFYSCLYAAACIGSAEQLSYLGDCAEGYQGNLCGACQDGYSRSGKYQCAKCPSQITNILRLIAVTIAVAIVVCVMVATTLNSAQKQKSEASIQIKILMNYLQIVTLAGSFSLEWPSTVLALFQYQATAGSLSEQAFSFDCFMGNSGQSVYNKVLIMTLFPVIIGTCAALVWLVIHIHKGYHHFPLDGLIATAVILLFLAHPMLTKSFFDLFTCYSVDGRFYLLQKLDVLCWDPVHFRYTGAVALPGILIWVLGVPTLCLVHLIRKRRFLTQIGIRSRLGFLFNGYRPAAYYWEFVILYRKILIICCSVFLTTVSITIQALCVLFVLVIALYMQDLARPFSSPALNRMELESVLCATITTYCGLFYLTKDLGEVAQSLLFACIVLVNGLFLWHWAKATIGLYVVMLIKKVPWLKRRIAPLISGLNDDFLDLEIETKRLNTADFAEIANLRTIRSMYLLRLRRDLETFSGSSAELEEAIPNSPNNSLQSLDVTMNTQEDEIIPFSLKSHE